MKEDTRISVVIPAYNAQSFIETALQSVVEQRYPRELIELIVVNDGSTDDTVSTVRAWAENNNEKLTLLESPNLGPSGARNLGWRAAKGDWIQFLDADDYLNNDKLRAQQSGIEVGDTRLGVLYSNWVDLLDRDGSWQANDVVHKPAVDEDPEAQLLEHRNFIQLGAQLISRRALESIHGFNESYSLVEDVELNLRLALDGWTYKKIKMNQPCLYFRKPADYENKYDRETFLEACLRNASMMENHWRNTNSLSESRIDILCDVYQPISRMYSTMDTARFNLVVNKLYSLRPNYIARHSLPLKVLSHLVGYRMAERIGALSRRLRGLE